MEFYHEKFKEIREARGISGKKLCLILDISRTTLWKWEKNKVTPSVDFIRAIAKALNVEASEISSLSPEPEKTAIDYSGAAETCNSLLVRETFNLKNMKLKKAINEIITLQGELDQTSLILNALFKGISLIFYIKDINLKYVAANKMFLQNLSMHYSYNVYGKTDYDFFPQGEARENAELDKKVLYKGKASQKEGFIFGSRKKRWGIIEKYPISDENGKITGMICTCKDVTEQRKAEAENLRLQREKDILFTAVNSFEKVIVLLYDRNPDGTIVYKFVSRNIEKILGYNVNSFIKNALPPISLVRPGQKKMIMDLFNGTLGLIEIKLFDFRKADGNYIKIEAKAEKREHPDGTATILGILTERE